ncbi:GNAT family N-acetyltransferase [Halochromatium roseum]|uniref:GNAT family N-acetyltransferase n=1 Tax=Halochromatium roseum TaxID=391920 RepID=UPI001912DCE5
MTNSASSPSSNRAAVVRVVRPAAATDAARWDEYVTAHSRSTPYHRWAWKQALEQGYGLATTYYLAENHTGDIIGVLPAARMPHPLRRGTLCALPYCDRGEPLADSADITTALTTGLLADETGPLELRGTRGDDTPLDDAATKKLEPGQKVRLLLDLPERADTLLAGFKSKHRSQINKARKNGLISGVGSGPERIDAFYPIFARNMRDLGSPTHSRRWFHAIAQHYGEDCLVGLVELNGAVVGAGIVLLAGPRAAIPWASTLRDSNHLAPNMLLYWALLEAVIERGARRFDFGRSSFGEGTYRFKTQWGARPVPLDWHRIEKQTDHTAIQDRQEPQPTQATTAPAGRIRRSAEALWRHLPLPLTIALGSRLRPWISL